MAALLRNGVRIIDSSEFGRVVQAINDGMVTGLSPEGFEAYRAGLYDFDMSRLGDEGPNGELLPVIKS